MLLSPAFVSLNLHVAVTLMDHEIFPSSAGIGFLEGRCRRETEIGHGSEGVTEKNMETETDIETESETDIESDTEIETNT